MDIAPEEIESAMLRLLGAAGAGHTVSPTDVARELKPGADWHVLMSAVRRVAIRLALGGRLTITRKGRPVDPNDFKGVYRLGLPRLD